jgi:2,3-bisphosphoglycerate-independent phosphoglycerate mutase
MIWLWGQGRRPAIEKFSDLYGMSGAVLSEMEYAKGIARLAGMTALDMDGTDEEPEVRYGRYAKRFSEVAQERDFVCLHFAACDEASMAGDYKAKISALESIDFFVLSKVKEYLEAQKDVRVIVTPSHSVPWKMRKHTRDSVPFVAAGKNMMADDYERFSETASKTSSLKISKGTEFLKFLLSK